MRYGMPYMGSKNKIVKWVIDSLPPAKNFYDIFCGGCAVSHAAMLSGKYHNFYINDINGTPLLFLNAVSGRLGDEKRWISRESFYKLKDEDMYVASVWSFGNNLKNYLYSQEVEPWKKALWHARVLNDSSLLWQMGIDTDGSRNDIKKHNTEYKEKYIRWYLKEIKNFAAADIESLIKQNKTQIEIEKDRLRDYLRNALDRSGFTQAEIDRRLGTQMSGHYFGRSQWEFPTETEYKKMQTFMPLEKDYNEIIGLNNVRKSLQSLERLQSLESLKAWKDCKAWKAWKAWKDCKACK